MEFVVQRFFVEIPHHSLVSGVMARWTRFTFKCIWFICFVEVWTEDATNQYSVLCIGHHIRKWLALPITCHIHYYKNILGKRTRADRMKYKYTLWAIRAGTNNNELVFYTFIIKNIEFIKRKQYFWFCIAIFWTRAQARVNNLTHHERWTQRQSLLIEINTTNITLCWEFPMIDHVFVSGLVFLPSS